MANDNYGDSCYAINFGPTAKVPELVVKKRVPEPDDDPWKNDPFMGTPKVVEDIDQVDFRDYDFKKFAIDNYKKPQPITRNRGTFLGTKFDLVVGSSPDNDSEFK